MITPDQARTLAVAYNAFNETDLCSKDIRDICAVLVWSKYLLAIQRETGVEIHPNNWLELIAADAERKYYA